MASFSKKYKGIPYFFPFLALFGLRALEYLIPPAGQ